jgi:hypothetical protein
MAGADSSLRTIGNIGEIEPQARLKSEIRSQKCLVACAVHFPTCRPVYLPTAAFHGGSAGSNFSNSSISDAS